MHFKDFLQLGFAFSKSYISFKLQLSPVPFSATIVVTNRCNLNCSYCNFPGRGSKELDINDIQSLFNTLYKTGVRRLGIMGGEPLLRKDIVQIINLAKKKGFFVSLNTNLLLYPKYTNQLDKVDLFLTSLDGDSSTHIANRGKGSYDGVIDTIQHIVNNSQPVIAICVINSDNLDQATFLLDLADQIGFKIHFQPHCVNSHYARGQLPKELTNEALRKFWQELKAKKRAGKAIASSLLFLEHMARWKDFSVTSFKDSSYQCSAGATHLFVDSMGDAYPCIHLPEKVTPVNLLAEKHTAPEFQQLPCTQCIVGPMAELNAISRMPVAYLTSLVQWYLKHQKKILHHKFKN